MGPGAQKAVGTLMPPVEMRWGGDARVLLWRGAPRPPCMGAGASWQPGGLIRRIARIRRKQLDLTDPELVVAPRAASGALVLGPPAGVEVAPAGRIAVAVPEVVVDVVPADTRWRVAPAAVHRDGNRRAGRRSRRSGLGARGHCCDPAGDRAFQVRGQDRRT